MADQGLEWFCNAKIKAGRFFRMAKKRDSLIVASKVKAYIKGKKMMTASDTLEALSEHIYSVLDAAGARAKANRRSTVRPQDL